MSNELAFDKAVVSLQDALAKLSATEKYYAIQKNQDVVLKQFQPLFAADHLPHLTAREFRSFLIFKNNRHWSGLHRQGPKITADMQVLRQALGLLLDQSQSIGERMSKAVGMVPGMGKAIATAVLMVTYPNSYGAWNNTSEEALRSLGLWPDFGWGMSLGQRYAQINTIMKEICAAVNVDLWTLDVLWWMVQGEQFDFPVDA